MVSIAFIGAGKMAEALMAQIKSPRRIVASDINRTRLQYLKKKYKIRIAKSNQEAFSASEIIILSVKPQNVPEVIAELARSLKGSRSLANKLLISIAAGIPLRYLQEKMPGFVVLRAMPNNPCLVGMGITALAKGKKVSPALLKTAEEIFHNVGEVIRVPEKWMDAITGLSGSGPAFVYKMIEGLIAGGVAAGLPRRVAQSLAFQTVVGGAATLAITGKSPADLVKMVASPGGTTVEGLKVLGQKKFTQAAAQAVLAAAKKSKVISRKWTS